MENESFVAYKNFNTPNRCPINTLLFSDDAKFLLSGGDDEKVRVWNMETGSCEQVLQDTNWGQVTHLIWAPQDLPSRENATVLCVGSARGYLSMFAMDSRGTKPFPKAATTAAIFAFNDSVEKLAFDKLNNRLAVTSHSGEIRVYSINKTSLRIIWSDNVGKVITSGLFFFGGANQSLLSIGLENSEMRCFDAARRGPALWTKRLIGGVGSAALSSDEKLLLVDNLATGNFDVYQISDNSPLRSLPTGSTRRFAKQCVFFEGSKIAVCRSDVNKIFIIDVAKNYVIQTLVTSQDIHMTQTVAVTPSSSRKVLVAASCDGTIFVWKKSAPRMQVDVRVDGLASRWLRLFAISLYIGLLAAASFNQWFPHARKIGDKIGGLAMDKAKGWVGQGAMGNTIGDLAMEMAKARGWVGEDAIWDTTEPPTPESVESVLNLAISAQERLLKLAATTTITTVVASSTSVTLM